MTPSRRYLLAATLLTAFGCEAFNPICEVDDTSVIGQTTAALDLRHAYVRTQEAPVGNLLADAFYDALQDAGAVAALVDAGSIWDRSDCGPHPTLNQGPIRLGDLAMLLPFDNSVALVQVTGSELAKSLEHGVAQLGEAGEVGFAPQFLQVSHLRFSVDCSKPAQQGDQIGQRISNIEIVADDGTPSMLDANATYLIATNTTLASGAYGYRWLAHPRLLTAPPADFMALATHIASLPERTVTPSLEGRLTLARSCAQVLP